MQNLTKVGLGVVVGLFLSLGLVGCGSIGSSSDATPISKATAYLGNLADANVSIYEMDENNNAKLKWSEKTSTSDMLDEIGQFNTHKDELNDNKYYLYEIVGGYDWDSDDDGTKDQSSSQNKGKIRAIIKGSRLKETDSFTVSYISEYIFKQMQNHIYNDDFESVKAKLIQELFDTDSNDTTVLSKLANQYIPYRDINNLKSDFKEFVPNLIQSIKDDNITDLTSLITFNNIDFLELETGNSGILRAELNITSKLSIGEINIVVGLDGNESESFDSIIIPKIKKGNFIYPIEIDLSTYYDEDENKTLSITGVTNLSIKINGVNTTLTKSINLLAEAFVKIQNITFEYDEELSKIIEIDEYTDINGTISTIKDTILSNLFELAINDKNLSFMPTIEIKNYFSDRNISNLKVETILIANNTEYSLPILDFNSSINIDSDSKKNLFLLFQLNQTNIKSIVNTMLNNTITAIPVNLITFNLFTSTLQEAINTNLDAITDIVVNNSEINSTLRFVLKEGSDTKDSFEYPINLKINSEIFEVFMENLPSLIDGNLTTTTLLNGI